jgi:hypothetical protein
MTTSSDLPRSGELAEESQAAPDSGIPLDVLFRILSNRIRRRILFSLSTRHGTDVPIDELADELMTDEEVLSRESLSATLYHNHIPRLVAAGVLEMDSEADTVRYRPDPRLEHVFESVSTDGW